MKLARRDTLDEALEAEGHRAARDASRDGDPRPLIEVSLRTGPDPHDRLAAAIAHLGLEHKELPDWEHGVWRRIDAQAWIRVLEYRVGEELTDAVVSEGHGDHVPDATVMRIAKRTARGVVRMLGIGDL